jgi:hypothetical protein
MKKLILFLLLTPVTSFAQDGFVSQISRVRSIDEVDRSKFDEYRYRRYSRWRNAIDTRREMNAGKVHRYWTAVIPPYYTGPMPVNYFQSGMIQQPPIYQPRREMILLNSLYYYGY